MIGICLDMLISAKDENDDGLSDLDICAEVDTILFAGKTTFCVSKGIVQRNVRWFFFANRINLSINLTFLSAINYIIRHVQRSERSRSAVDVRKVY